MGSYKSQVLQLRQIQVQEHAPNAMISYQTGYSFSMCQSIPHIVHLNLPCHVRLNRSCDQVRIEKTAHEPLRQQHLEHFLSLNQAIAYLLQFFGRRLNKHLYTIRLASTWKLQYYENSRLSHKHLFVLK